MVENLYFIARTIENWRHLCEFSPHLVILTLCIRGIFFSCLHDTKTARIFLKTPLCYCRCFSSSLETSEYLQCR